MPGFRCYFLDREGHIKGRTEIQADALSEAIERALELLTAHPEHHGIEVWSGLQRLYRQPGVNNSGRPSAERS